jgi:molybdopterin/thiamine biosynthesis adenylyltransferase
MRYKYQALLAEIGEKGQKELNEKNVAIAGLGGVGSILAEMFTRSGIGLRLIDKERIYEEDLQRQAVFKEEHINKFKAKEAKKSLTKINAATKIRTFHEELVSHNAYLLDSDVAIDCTNDLATSELIEKHCTKIPLILCRYSGKEGYIYIKDKTTNIAKHKAKLEKIKPIKETGVLTSATHMAASIIFSEAIKILLKKKDVSKGLIYFDSWNNKIIIKK